MAFDFNNPQTDISQDIKQKVRKQCGHGCVICGALFVSFISLNSRLSPDHPENIALLCPNCHRKIKHGSWSIARAKLAMRFPKSRQNDFKRSFSLAGGLLSLEIAGARLSHCPSPIKVAGHPLFTFNHPNRFPKPLLFSSYFVDSTDTLSLIINNNEWSDSGDIWDVTTCGSRITITERQGITGIQIRVRGAQVIVLEALNMRLAGFHFELVNETLIINQPPESKGLIASQLLSIHPDIPCEYR